MTLKRSDFPADFSRRLRRRLPLALAGALALLAGGCVSYRAKPLTAESGAAALAARSLDDPGLRRFMAQNPGRAAEPWPLPRWNLAALTQAAWYYHPDMAVARAELAASEAEVRAAGERPEPGIGFAPQFNSNAPAGLSPWTLGFNLDLPIETAGKRAKRVAVASAQADAARDGLAAAAWRVRSRARTALLDLWAAREESALRRRQLAAQAGLAALWAQRFSAGEVARSLATQARIVLEQDRLAAGEAAQREREAQAELAQSLGVPVSALAGVRLDFGALTKNAAGDLPPAPVLRRLALQARPEVLAGLADYAASEAALRLEVAKQYPDLHLGPGYTWDQGADKWSVGIGLTLPVFNRNRGAIARAEAARGAAAARFQALQAKILGELETAGAGYRATRARLRDSSAALAAQTAQLGAVQAQFQAGEADRLDLLNARLQLADARLAHLRVLVQAQAGVGALEDAIERPLGQSRPERVSNIFSTAAVASPLP